MTKEWSELIERLAQLDQERVVFGVGLRALAIVQVIAFVSLWRDVLGIAGSQGLQPVADVLAAYKRDYGWRRFIYAPSLLHFAHSDAALRRLTIIGVVSSSAAAVGGPHTPVALAVSALIYLSYDVAVDYFYPWDCMLCEANVLAAFAPALAFLPIAGVGLETPAHPLVTWAFRFLAFRIVFGFGKYKFFGPGKLQSSYLKTFLVAQPMPRALGLRMQSAPLVFHQIGLGVLFVIEVLSPFLWLGSPMTRRVASVLSIGLMLAIQLTGNFGFFNVGMIAIAVIAATPSVSSFDVCAGGPAGLLDVPHVLAALLLVAGVIHLPFNSWVARSWMYWPDLERFARGALRPIMTAMRAIAPFRLVHGYGVFAPESAPCGQWVPLIEGTNDEITWHPYRFRYYQSDASFRGVSIAPFFPRFDHTLIYDAMGFGLGNLMGSVVGGGNPYRATRALFMERVQRRLLEGSLDVRALFSHVPFERPLAVRVSLEFHAYTGTSFRRVPLGEHTPARTLETSEAVVLPHPAEFLPDDRIWSERARAAARDVHGLESESEIFRAAWKLRANATPGRGHGEFELWLIALATAANGVPGSASEGLILLAKLRPNWVRFHARKARLAAATMRGARHEAPSFAPGFLRWLPVFESLDPTSEVIPSLFDIELGGHANSAASLSDGV